MIDDCVARHGDYMNGWDARGKIEVERTPKPVTITTISSSDSDRDGGDRSFEPIVCSVAYWM